MENKEQKLVSVFTTNNYPLFEIAKSILDNYKVEYFPTGEYFNNVYSAIDCLEIKVFEKDEETARKLLDKLRENKYYSSGKFSKKSTPYIGYLIIGAIIFMIIAMIIIFSLVKK